MKRINQELDNPISLKDLREKAKYGIENYIRIDWWKPESEWPIDLNDV